MPAERIVRDQLYAVKAQRFSPLDQCRRGDEDHVSRRVEARPARPHQTKLERVRVRHTNGEEPARFESIGRCLHDLRGVRQVLEDVPEGNHACRSERREYLERVIAAERLDTEALLKVTGAGRIHLDRRDVEPSLLRGPRERACARPDLDQVTRLDVATK